MHDHDALGLQVIIEGLGAMFAAKPACLDSAKRQLVVAIMQGVHPHITGLKPVDRRLNMVEVLAPD